MKPCSGLGSFEPCAQRQACANYRHWMDDPRSQFNICTPTGTPFKHFAQVGMPIEAKPIEHQGSLF